ncbi:hypothetical protein BOTNAR_0083g00090 [Botryotinia narcissicola]|uniref:Uncharacterized protein n=1 Tax=Botryotinia narcissicola TaxID=278944 RepID=A0A4Z1IUA8_9HELO|nr:hypothetical protein BOTNAR_0083g00090 [Botryotinia narcissicola]
MTSLSNNQQHAAPLWSMKRINLGAEKMLEMPMPIPTPMPTQISLPLLIRGRNLYRCTVSTLWVRKGSCGWTISGDVSGWHDTDIDD